MTVPENGYTSHSSYAPIRFRFPSAWLPERNGMSVFTFGVKHIYTAFSYKEDMRWPEHAVICTSLTVGAQALTPPSHALKNL